MLVVLFSIGEDRYAIRAAEVFEITPVLELKEIPGAPRFVAGLCNFRGKPMPVLDLSALARGVPCQLLLSTRMIVVNFVLDSGGVRPLGLLAEHATQTANIDEATLQPSGVSIDNSPYLGQVAVSSGELVQLVEVEELLPAEVLALLYRDER